MFRNLVEGLAVKYAHASIQRSLYKEFNIKILDSNESYDKIPQKGKKYMLYAHVPFCHTFCPYCSFHKYHYEQNLAKHYFEALRTEIRQMKEVGYEFSSLYVGGGTTLINEPELEKTLILIKDLFNIDEISAESDPNHISSESLKRFDGLITRLSVGVQSFDDEILKKVDRYEKFGSADEIKRKIEKALGIFPALSLDLIFNLPNQSETQLRNDLKCVKDLAPEQATFYPLMKSELTRESIARSLGVSNIDNEKKFYDIICDELKDWHQNNAWAFAKNSSELKDEYVASNAEYVGVGSGAFSFLNGELIINAFNLLEYGQKVKNKQSAVIAKCGFDHKEKLKYIFLTKLFDGCVNIENFNTLTNSNLKKELFTELNLLKLAGAITDKDGIIRPTHFGNYLCVVLMRDFYAGMDRVRALFKDDARIKRTKMLRVMQEKIEEDSNNQAIVAPRASF